MIKKKLQLALSNNKGFSLLELTIGAGLFAGVFSLATQAFILQLKTNRQIESKLELEDVRQWVRLQLDCSKTFPVGSPSCGTNNISILNKRDQIKIKIDETSIQGKYSIRAKCTDDGNIKILDVQIKENNTVSWKSLFNVVPIVCKIQT